ncbi:acyclic terpene utilization AtuA family protein [Candidatus Formimonas warabiya]|uniref:Acyclic terpene utilisation N-terminal domain-containing protein n=1 Tax=Formimonas warabiya TaxID=1761012 RepID=A0A3G1KTN0_FORW1|nr:acyclic terpene utilization AtuA family protein [Candidatus Formimonas warabiya]ATW25863.1 hypothetical protein DCMF_14770 [Candidatus Formimonas warabiya]
MKKEFCLLATNGSLGGGFKEETFYKALDMKPDVIAADSGSIDPGPYYLGMGRPRMSRKASKWELRLMITEGVKRNIPVLIGSAGTAGADPNVDWLMDIVKEIAAEENLHFKLAEIKTEIKPETLRKYLRAGKMKALNDVPEFKEEDIESVTRCVAVIGAEPYCKALEEGAQVIIAGRSTDTAIFAAVPKFYGLDNAYTWHAGKLLECGAACCVHRPYNDCMMAWVSENSLVVEPPNPIMRCSPTSCAAHTLYENADPFHLVEPSGALITTDTVYEQIGERSVKITGSRFEYAKQYTCKVEGVKFLGYRRVVIGGVTDPLILKQLDSYIQNCIDIAQRKIERTMGLKKEDYLLRYFMYGNPNAADPGQVGVVFDVVARTESDAEAILGNIWHIALHTPIKEWEGLQSNMAFPFSPPTMSTLDGGATYSFCLNHVLELDDPLELVRFKYYEL